MMRDSQMANGSGTWAVRMGWTLSALVGLFLVADAIMKVMRLPVVLETMTSLGWPADWAVPLGIILLITAALFLYPRTSIVGAILLTGYLGGAVATHARIGSPLLTHTFFGIYIGILAWTGLYLRDVRLRSVVRPM